MEISSIGISLMSSTVSVATSDASVGGVSGVFVRDSFIPVNASNLSYTVILNLVKARVKISSSQVVGVMRFCKQALRFAARQNWIAPAESLFRSCL